MDAAHSDPVSPGAAKGAAEMFMDASRMVSECSRLDPETAAIHDPVDSVGDLMPHMRDAVSILPAMGSLPARRVFDPDARWAGFATGSDGSAVLRVGSAAVIACAAEVRWTPDAPMRERYAIAYPGLAANARRALRNVLLSDIESDLLLGNFQATAAAIPSRYGKKGGELATSAVKGISPGAAVRLFKRMESRCRDVADGRRGHLLHDTDGVVQKGRHVSEHRLLDLTSMWSGAAGSPMDSGSQRDLWLWLAFLTLALKAEIAR